MKKEKNTKNCVKRIKLKSEDYKNCLEAVQIENKINHFDLDSLKNDHKEFIKNSKLILKTQERFRSENHNDFTEKMNGIFKIKYNQ